MSQKWNPSLLGWDEGLEPGTIYSGASFGTHFGMSGHRFENITQCLCLEDPQPGIRVDEVGSETNLKFQCISLLFATYISRILGSQLKEESKGLIRRGNV